MTDLSRGQSLETTRCSPNPATDRVFREKLEAIFVSNASAASRVEAFVNQQPTLLAGKNDASPGTRDKGRTDERQEIDRNDVVASKLGFPSIAGGFTVLATEEEVKQYVRSNGGFNAIFVKQRNSFSPLWVSPSLFEVLCHEVGISRRFRDFVVHLGDKDCEIEIAPPPAWLKPSFSGNPESPESLELMFGVRFVELNNRADVGEPSSQWSLRQCAVYYQHHVRTRRTSWAFVTISPAARERITESWSTVSNPAHISPIDIMTTVYETAVYNWRPYLVSLTTEVDQHTARSFGTSMDDEGPVQATGYSDLQSLRMLENKVLSAKLAINATRDDLAALKDEFERIRDFNFYSTSSEPAFGGLPLAYLLRDLHVNLSRLDHLSSRLRSTTEIVSVYLNLNNEAALQELSKDSRYENRTMRHLNERMAELAEQNSQDSATVTVLTILTLIYLPITVVSNFFSTSFVGTGTTSNRIFVTKDWWILFVTAIPLTVFTLYVWWVWSRIRASRDYPVWWPRSLRSGHQVGSEDRRLPRRRRDIEPSSHRDVSPGARGLHVRQSWGLSS